MSEINGLPTNTDLVLPTDSLNARVQKLREEYDTAGLKRNNLEVAWNQACENHGADSEEAKAAKAQLNEAQAQLERIQAALREAVKAAIPPKKNEKAPSPKKIDHYKLLHKLLPVPGRPMTPMERLQPLFLESSTRAVLFLKK